MVTAEELVVSITSSGVGETREELEGVEGAMEDTAESAGDSAEQLEGFSQQFAGAMSAAVAALSIGTAGLLSQVPIIGEQFAGLAAIVNALALQVDQLLRPALTPLTGILFEVANAILEANGVAGDLLGIFAVVATAVASAAVGLAAWAVKVKGAVGAASALIGALKTAGTVLAGIVGGITATTAAIAIVIAAIAAFALAYITNFRGVRDTTNNIIGQIVDFVVGGFMKLATMALDALGSLASGVRNVLGSVASRIASWAGDLASDAREWGVNIMDRFLSGIRSMLSAVRDVLSDIPFIGQILDLFDRLSEAIGDLDLSGTATANLQVGGGNTRGGGGGGGGASTGRPRFGASRSGSGNVYLDGRKQTEDTGRYRSDPNRRRGI